MQDFVTLRQNLGFQERFLSSKIKLKERQRLDHQAPIDQHGAAFPEKARQMTGRELKERLVGIRRKTEAYYRLNRLWRA